MKRPANVLLQGIVGSVAYGLNTATSDVDRLGVFAAPTTAFHGLGFPAESLVSTAPDATFHEARKYAGLALRGNPTVTELMWLPAELYETRHPLGDDLIAVRQAFLAAKPIRDAYLGYATQQLKRLEGGSGGSSSPDAGKRIAKHARHLLRLCAQGFELYTTGNLPIRLDDPQRFRDFGEQVAADGPDVAHRTLADYEQRFDTTASVLPAEPDRAAVEAWLRSVRAAFWTPDDQIDQGR